MSVYGSGVEAYRSTAKWLVSLVPIATIVTAGIAFGPDLVEKAATLDEGEFFNQHWPAMAGVLLIAGGLGVVVWQAAALLSEQAPNVTTLESELLDKAFGAGVAVPYFVDQATYQDAQNQLTAWVDSQRSDSGSIDCQSKTQKPDSELVKALSAAVDALREWALHHDISKQFLKFNLWFAGGVLAMVAGLLIAAIDLTEPTVERRDPPVAVMATLSDEAWNDMNSVLGCGAAIDGTRPDVQLWLVAGDWENPILQVDGEGCATATDWDPKMKIAPRPEPSE